ncbi:MAG: hypothetical protein GX616_00015 [Planctomycetes bacterium]|nr:hypothetical protein [Planctomycetota bacterium]
MRKPLLIGTIALGVLMIAAGVLWLTSPQGSASSLSDFTTPHADGVPRITPAVLNSLLRGDDAPLVWEFRSAETYEAQHVPGSRLVTLDEIAGAAAGLDKGQAIVTLCT